MNLNESEKLAKEVLRTDEMKFLNYPDLICLSKAHLKAVELLKKVDDNLLCEIHRSRPEEYCAGCKTINEIRETLND